MIELLDAHPFDLNQPATGEALAQLEEVFGALPDDYRALLRVSDGLSLAGFKTPLIVFSIREVLALHREHDLYAQLPDALIFGGDGGGVVFAFDARRRVVTLLEDDARFGNARALSETATLTRFVERIIAGEKLNLV